MKTAISIPDDLYRDAEKYAKLHKISRSELYQEALLSYLSDSNSSDVTKRLDQVYANEDSRLPDAIVEMQARTIRKNNEPW